MMPFLFDVCSASEENKKQNAANILNRLAEKARICS
jgi:hypothetical protein